MTPDVRQEDGSGPAAAIAAAVLAVDGVVALSSGPAGQFRTYLTGGRSIAGVRIDDESLRVDVVARYGRDLDALGTKIAGALSGLVGDRAVMVTVDDVVLPGESEQAYLEADQADSESPA